MNYKKYQILKSSLGQPHRTGTELLYYCPKCKHHKKKLSVNIDKNKFKCWICDYKGNNIGKLIRRWGSFSDQQAWSEFLPVENKSDLLDILRGKTEVESEQVISLPKEFQTLVTKVRTSINSVPRRYLSQRNICEKDIFKYKIGFCPTGDYSGRIIVPSFNPDGKINYFIARTFSGDYQKYKNPEASKDIIFNELSVDWDEDVTLVEGVFDAMNVHNSIPLLGSTLSRHSRLFNKIVQECPDIYVALDSDAEDKSIRILNLLKKYDVNIYKVDIRPFADIGEMSKEQFLSRKGSAISYLDSMCGLRSALGMI